MSAATLEKLNQLLKDLSEAEQLELIAFIAEKLKKESQMVRPVDLAGYLADKMDPDTDIDAILKEIRGAWKHEWDV